MHQNDELLIFSCRQVTLNKDRVPRAVLRTKVYTQAIFVLWRLKPVTGLVTCSGLVCVRWKVLGKAPSLQASQNPLKIWTELPQQFQGYVIKQGLHPQTSKCSHLRERTKVWLLELLCEGYQRTKLFPGGIETEFQIFSHSYTAWCSSISKTEKHA